MIYTRMVGTLPAHPHASPAHREASPTHREASPAHREASPAPLDAAPGLRDRSPVHREAPPSGGSAGPIRFGGRAAESMSKIAFRRGGRDVPYSNFSTPLPMS